MAPGFRTTSDAFSHARLSGLVIPSRFCAKMSELQVRSVADVEGPLFMKRPLIAVIGRLAPYESDESPVREPDLLRAGLVNIGKALADSDFRIMVYTVDPKFDYAAKYVVQGFREGRKKGTPKSIIVKRAAVEPTDQFPEEETDPRYLLDVRKEEPWEIRFYFSLFEIDGIIVVGNGNFTYFGGLQAVGSDTPVLALGGFGGVANKILALLKNKIPEDAYNCMAQTRGNEEWARECVVRLRERIENAKRAVEESKEAKRLREVIWAGVFTTVIIIIILAVLAQSLRPQWSWVQAYGTAFLPAIAGLVGALQRIVFAHFRGEDIPLHRRSFWVCGALGFSAGGMLGAVYTLTQVRMGSANSEPAMFAPLFLWAITFGYGVGFSLERAFNRLLHLDEAASATAHESGTRNSIKTTARPKSSP
jgi:hypothetical protein